MSLSPDPLYCISSGYWAIHESLPHAQNLINDPVWNVPTYDDGSVVCEAKDFDPTKGRRLKHPDDGAIAWEDENGYIWEQDRARTRGHGGSAWKRWKNKKAWQKGRKKPKTGRDGTYDKNGNRLRD